MTGLCTECPSRAICSTLCPEAELYAKQDEAAQRELTIGLPRYGQWPEPFEKSPFTPTEKKILHALVDGKTRSEIAKELGISRETLRKHIGNIRKKREEKTPLLEGE
jgi:DNA-binding NarL/FixJ family response regulator